MDLETQTARTLASTLNTTRREATVGYRGKEPMNDRRATSTQYNLLVQQACALSLVANQGRCDL